MKKLALSISIDTSNNQHDPINANFSPNASASENHDQDLVNKIVSALKIPGDISKPGNNVEYYKGVIGNKIAEVLTPGFSNLHTEAKQTAFIRRVSADLNEFLETKESKSTIEAPGKSLKAEGVKKSSDFDFVFDVTPGHAAMISGIGSRVKDAIEDLKNYGNELPPTRNVVFPPSPWPEQIKSYLSGKINDQSLADHFAKIDSFNDSKYEFSRVPNNKTTADLNKNIQSDNVATIKTALQEIIGKDQNYGLKNRHSNADSFNKFFSQLTQDLYKQSDNRNPFASTTNATLPPLKELTKEAVQDIFDKHIKAFRSREDEVTSKKVSDLVYREINSENFKSALAENSPFNSVINLLAAKAFEGSKRNPNETLSWLEDIHYKLGPALKQLCSHTEKHTDSIANFLNGIEVTELKSAISSLGGGDKLIKKITLKHIEVQEQEREQSNKLKRIQQEYDELLSKFNPKTFPGLSDDINLNNPSRTNEYPNKKPKRTPLILKSLDDSGLNYPSRVDGNKMNPKKKKSFSIRVKHNKPLYPGRG
jgi:hypothetical protein